MSTDKETPRRGVLGKGLKSLLGDPPTSQEGEGVRPTTTTAKDSIFRIDPNLIDPNPHQPRRVFDDDDLHELAASIKLDGVLQPLIVSKSDQTGRYMLVAGERRLRASKLSGQPTVPVLVREGVSNDLLRLALIENVQRSDLNIIEEAEAYRSLIEDHGLTQEQCADGVGKDRSTITNTLRLLALPKEVQDDLLEGRLSMGHGRALLSLDDAKSKLRARDIVIKKGLNVRQTEQLCKNYKLGQDLEKRPGATSGEDADLEYVADSLRTYLKTKVRINGNPVRGKIEVSYFSAAELERILGLFGQKFV